MNDSTVPVLSVRGLVKAYHDRPVLNGIDLDVVEHQVVVLIGASGSGKSTLLRCVDLLEDIDDGQILLDGRDISDPRIDADAARVFKAASPDERRKLEDLVSACLLEVKQASASLSQVMGEVGRNAQRRELTTEILRSILNGD